MPVFAIYLLSFYAISYLETPIYSAITLSGDMFLAPDTNFDVAIMLCVLLVTRVVVLFTSSSYLLSYWVTK